MISCVFLSTIFLCHRKLYCFVQMVLETSELLVIFDLTSTSARPRASLNRMWHGCCYGHVIVKRKWYRHMRCWTPRPSSAILMASQCAVWRLTSWRERDTFRQLTSKVNCSTTNWQTARVNIKLWLRVFEYETTRRMQSSDVYSSAGGVFTNVYKFTSRAYFLSAYPLSQQRLRRRQDTESRTNAAPTQKHKASGACLNGGHVRKIVLT